MIEHETLTVLGSKVCTTDGDFRDLAQCDTPLGLVYFCREQGGRWSWGWEIESRAADDNDVLAPAHDTASDLERAAAQCELFLKCVVDIVARKTDLRWALNTVEGSISMAKELGEDEEEISEVSERLKEARSVLKVFEGKS